MRIASLMTVHSNELWLHHPSGANILLIGTQHVSATHANKTGAAVASTHPTAVVLELDEARFQQVDFRLRALLHADTATLMQLTAGDPQDTPLLQRLLPDALLWVQHTKQFALMRNEGVPLLLGSLYGSDFLNAALAAAALPQPAAVVLADQPQQQTLERFRQLVDASGSSWGQLLARLLWGDLSEDSNCNRSNSASSCAHSPQQQQQQLSSIFTAAAQLAAGRLVHLFLQWWSMALTCRSRWYGEHVHPVFWLVGNEALQQKLIARGCQGVADAAAAAGRLLQVAAAAADGSSGGSSGCLPAVEDVQAIRRFTQSLEHVMWSASAAGGGGSNDGFVTGSGSSSSSSGGSSGGGSQIMHATSAAAAGVEGLGELMPLRPWWVTLSERFSHHLTHMAAAASPPAAAATGGCAHSSSSSCDGSSNSSSTGGGLLAALRGHQHADVTAAAAYEQAVMAERNWVLTSTLWSQAAAAAAAAADADGADADGAAGGKQLSQVHAGVQARQQQSHADVVAVVGYNHLPGISQLWKQLEQQHEHQREQQHAQRQHLEQQLLHSSPGSPNSLQDLRLAEPPQGAFLPWQVAATDAAAGVLELAAAGGAGLCYLSLVNRIAPAAAAATAAAAAAGNSRRAGGFSASRVAALGSSSGGWRRLGLLLLPAAAALLPLQLDAKRLQEAGELLSRVAVVNDVILRQERAVM